MSEPLVKGTSLPILFLTLFFVAFACTQTLTNYSGMDVSLRCETIITLLHKKKILMNVFAKLLHTPREKQKGGEKRKPRKPTRSRSAFSAKSASTGLSSPTGSSPPTSGGMASGNNTPAAPSRFLNRSSPARSLVLFAPLCAEFVVHRLPSRVTSRSHENGEAHLTSSPIRFRHRSPRGAAE